MLRLSCCAGPAAITDALPLRVPLVAESNGPQAHLQHRARPRGSWALEPGPAAVAAPGLAAPVASGVELMSLHWQVNS